MNLLKSIRFQLSLWFVGSVVSLSLFFYYVIHIFMWPNGEFYFVLLVILLAIVGLWLVYKITVPLTRLSKSISDISARNLDQKITGIESENEIGQLANTFNELLDRIHQAFERERQFIGDVAHELKTPLTVLSGTLENALAKERKSEEYRDALIKSLEESRRLSATFNNLLDLAWTEAPQQEQHKSKINVSQLMVDVVEITQSLAGVKSISIDQDIANNVYCLGNKDKLARAILNLADNAIKFSPSNSVISLKLQVQSGKAIIHVEDQGPGIPSAERDKVFERFYRSRQTQDRPGTGLGLPLVKSIVRLHSGHIFVTSNRKHGTIFTITLPLA